MAITSGYHPHRYDPTKSPAVAAFNESIKASTRMVESIHPDGLNHTPGCSEASTRMVESIHPDAKKHTPGRRKSNKKRDGMTQEEFLALSRSEQLEIINEFLGEGAHDKDFDESGRFAFSITTLKNRAADLGFSRVWVDNKLETETVSLAASERTITISRDARSSVKEKTFTLSASTLSSLASLFDDVKVTNEEKSKIIDAIISSAVDEVLAAKQAGELHIEYAEKLEAIQQKNMIL